MSRNASNLRASRSSSSSATKPTGAGPQPAAPPREAARQCCPTLEHKSRASRMLPARMSFHNRLHKRSSASALDGCNTAFVRIGPSGSRDVDKGLPSGSHFADELSASAVSRHAHSSRKNLPSNAVPSSSALRNADDALDSSQAIILFNLNVTGSLVSSREAQRNRLLNGGGKKLPRAPPSSRGVAFNISISLPALSRSTVAPSPSKW
mmetsp:Transcript_5954/g.21479  ORF Transcript_5954/g.21479 Transcript_5954/m.21479 type:complete len:208 (+) Transcript_5954:2185-2808(+)